MSIVAVHGPSMAGDGGGGGTGGVPGDGDPGISGVTPATAVVGASPITITVNGNDFVDGSIIEVDQIVEAPTTFVSATQLTTTFTPATAKTVSITVRNPDDSESNNFSFVITATEEDAGGGDTGGETQSVDDDEYASAGFDPAAHTVAEVEAYVEEHPEEIEQILDLEDEGKQRTTLIAFLEAKLGDE